MSICFYSLQRHDIIEDSRNQERFVVMSTPANRSIIVSGRAGVCVKNKPEVNKYFERAINQTNYKETVCA